VYHPVIFDRCVSPSTITTRKRRDVSITLWNPPSIPHPLPPPALHPAPGKCWSIFCQYDSFLFSGFLHK
jgi:hypothetical protein